MCRMARWSCTLLMTITGAALILLPAQAQTPVAWASQLYGVAVTVIPGMWRAEHYNDSTLRLSKRFVANGMWFDERITLTVALGSYARLETAIRDTGDNGFQPVQRERLSMHAATAPFWLSYRRDDADAADWLAIVFHAGKVVVVDLRSTILDSGVLSEFTKLLEAIRFFQDERERAWMGVLANTPGEARALFERLLARNRADVNARYGLGLAELASSNVELALRDLQLAAPGLGLKEDVRRALGRAELARGNVDRAAALWIEVLRADPTWDRELLSWLLSVEKGAGGRSPSRSAEAAAGLLASAADQFLRFSHSGREAVLNELLSGFRETFDELIKECLSQPCGMGNVLRIYWDIEVGMNRVLSGTETNDGNRIYDGSLALAARLRDLGTEGK